MIILPCYLFDINKILLSALLIMINLNNTEIEKVVEVNIKDRLEKLDYLFIRSNHDLPIKQPTSLPDWMPALQFLWN